MSRCAWDVRAIADSGTLCRVIGMFAQLGLAPPDLDVRNCGEEIVIRIRTDADAATATALDRRIAAVFGVTEVTRRHAAAELADCCTS